MRATLNGIRVIRVNSTIFIPLPRELWREIEGGCCCPYCSTDWKKSEPAFWDTVAVSIDTNYPHTWTVHHPEGHGAKRKRKAA